MSTSMTLLELRTASRQRADMVNSTFVSDAEFNSYINQSYFELYDLLVTTYEDYYVAPPLVIPTTSVAANGLLALPDGVLYTAAPPFYKLLGVDLGLSNSNNAWVTIKRFEFISRNRYLYPQLNSTYLGVFNISYHLTGNNLMIIPQPSGGQFLRLWYIPRMVTLTLDADLADGISGWTEYIIVDAAIKAGQKEETDVALLVGQKNALIKRIEETSMNRDAGQPSTISDTRTRGESWGGAGYDGSNGGF